MNQEKEWERYAEHLCSVVRRQSCPWCEGDKSIEVPCPIQPDRTIWIPCPECGEDE